MPKTKHLDRRIQALRKATSNRDPHGMRRVIALLFGFCRRCRKGACRRADSCLGEGAPCFNAFWPAVPEIRKDLFREMVKARCAGAKTVEEIEEIAFSKIMARYTPEQIREAAAQAATGG